MNTGDRLCCALDARGVLTITLNRPAEHNALDGAMVSELMRTFESAGQNPAVRVVALRGAGPVFSEGTDFAWLERMVAASRAESLRDAKSLAEMFDFVDSFAKPVAGVVHGAVTGDALGLVATCDVVVASADTVFRATDLAAGLVPACVAPYLIAKVGGSHARNILLSGRAFSSARAREIRLVHDIVASPSELDAALEDVVDGMLRAAPYAYKLTKALIRRLTYHGHSLLSTDTLDDVATCLTASRASQEVREGLEAQREGRPPSWAPKPPA